MRVSEIAFDAERRRLVLVETLRATPDVFAIPRKGETWWGELADGYPVVT